MRPPARSTPRRSLCPSRSGRTSSARSRPGLAGHARSRVQSTHRTGTPVGPLRVPRQRSGSRPHCAPRTVPASCAVTHSNLIYSNILMDTCGLQLAACERWESPSPGPHGRDALRLECTNDSPSAQWSVRAWRSRALIMKVLASVRERLRACMRVLAAVRAQAAAVTEMNDLRTHADAQLFCDAVRFRFPLTRCRFRACLFPVFGCPHRLQQHVFRPAPRPEQSSRHDRRCGAYQRALRCAAMQTVYDCARAGAALAGAKRIDGSIGVAESGARRRPDLPDPRRDARRLAGALRRLLRLRARSVLCCDTHAHAQIRTHTHACARTHAQKRTQTRVHTHPHRHTRTHTHAHTCTHAHARARALRCCCGR
jgi:hypothetical protein